MSAPVATKTEFAKLAGVSRARVSQWIAGKKIAGDALVGEGRHARIRVPVALEQLRRNLDLDQRLGANGKARLDGEPGSAVVPDLIEQDIKRQRLEQLALANAKAREEAAARTGRYIEAEEARQQLGRVASRMVTMFDVALTEFANTIAAHPPTSSREALQLLQATWRDIRARQANAAGADAVAAVALIEDAANDDAAL